ncbi:MAG: xanthine dehydrogenase family protein molybdopterin-binding subunit, partial [Planctomycetota bacterium]
MSGPGHLEVPPSPTPYAEQPRGVVGHSCHRLDGADKTTGAICYGADLFPKQAELFAGVVRSEQAHARLLSIDTSEAARVEGVVGVYTHRDVPGTNLHGLIRRDHPVLTEDRVRYVGDAVALVVGTSEQAVHQAGRTVRADYEPLPVIADIDAALAPSAYELYPGGNIMGGKRIRKGQADAALAESDVVVTETFQTQTVDHAFLDLEAGVARYETSGQGLLTIQVSGQWVHEERRLIALALGLEPEHIRIIQPATGGAFGGREDISIQIYLGLAALKHPNKTVALRYDRGESMRARHKRHAIRVEYTLGARPDGTLTAAKVVVWSDEGAYASTGPAVMRKASSHATGPYRVPNVSVDVYGVHTNNNPTGAMRGFGACQMAIAYEGMMDRLAQALGCDRYELRRQNLIRAGDAVTTGQRLPVATVTDCLETAMDQFRAGGSAGPALEQPPEPHLRRGYGMSAICFGLGYGDGFPDCARARVAFDQDGRAVVYTGGVDVGQGFDNMVAQIAADDLGLDLGQVRVVAADTALTDESGSSSATRQTYFSGNAV